jgi:hypothetical protein
MRLVAAEAYTEPLPSIAHDIELSPSVIKILKRRFTWHAVPIFLK